MRTDIYDTRDGSWRKVENTRAVAFLLAFDGLGVGVDGE
jgi:hypothetical protein